MRVQVNMHTFTPSLCHHRGPAGEDIPVAMGTPSPQTLVSNTILQEEEDTGKQLTWAQAGNIPMSLEPRVAPGK